MKINIVILDAYAANPGDLSWDGLAALGNLMVYDRTAPEEFMDRAADAEVLLTNKTLITADLMKACKKLKYIGVLATGYNVVDTAAAKELGITVTNIPAYSTPSVAQMTFSLLLEICEQVGLHNQAVKAGEWENCADFCFWKKPLIELAGKTFGIVGYGKIGQAVAEIALAFGMHVIVSTRTPSKVTDTRVECVTLEELYGRADVISLHCPLTEQSKEMINRESIQKMKEGASRGSDTMGMKHFIKFGIYVIKGSINVQLAEKTGFTEEDSNVVKECLRTLFINDSSSARPDGSMEVVKLFWFEHNCKEGQYSSAKVHRSVKITQRDPLVEPSSINDYDIIVEPLDNLTPEVIEGV